MSAASNAATGKESGGQDQRLPLQSFDAELCIVAYGSEEFAPIWLRTAEWLGVSLAVADNASEPTSIDAVVHAPVTQPDDTVRLSPTRAAPKLRTLHLPTNPGFGAACNRLAESSTATWLLFVNPDARITAIPFDPTLVFRSGFVTGATVLNSSDGWTHCAGQSYRVIDEVARSWLRRKPPTPPNSAGGGYVSGGAFAIERSKFLELGGFDEQFFLFYEDIDLCMRAHDAGLTIRQAEQWVVVHDGGHATKRNWSNALKTSYASGRRFHQKHHPVPVIGSRAYDLYVLIDSALRGALSLAMAARGAPGATDRANAYGQLVREAARNLMTKPV